ncbi:MAG: tryptophan synthase subunit alpha [Chloroflexota bacterium]
MSRIDTTFRRLRKSGEIALIPYLTVGYPTLEITRQLLPVIGRQGADLIELGIPFSDPLADGATVQRAYHAALENGVTVADCLSVAADARRSNEIPLLFMSYYNPIHAYGLKRFAADCAQAGIDGLIIPDLPPEEAAPIKAECESPGIDLIFLLAPTSTDDRIKMVAELASGFIYCVSLTGVTGARHDLGEAAGSLVARVRQHTELPLVVGFGIGTPEQVAQVARIADGAVVGSALINLLESHPADEPMEIMMEAADYIRALKEATALQPAP